MNPLKIRQIRSQNRKQHIFFLVAKLLLLLVGFFRSKMKLHEAGNPFRSRFSQDIYHWQWWVRVKGPKMDSFKKMTFAKVEMYETYVKHLWNICHIELMNPPNRCPFFEDIFGPPPKKRFCMSDSLWACEFTNAISLAKMNKEWLQFLEKPWNIT